MVASVVLKKRLKRSTLPEAWWSNEMKFYRYFFIQYSIFVDPSGQTKRLRRKKG
jgi:hypothetical protein